MIYFTGILLFCACLVVAAPPTVLPGSSSLTDPTETSLYHVEGQVQNVEGDSGSPTNAVQSGPSIALTADVGFRTHECKIEEHFRVKRRYIQDGINYLRSVREPCTSPAHGCERISCSHSAAIYLCSHTDQDIARNCSEVADYAQEVYDRCEYRFKVRGEIWSWEHFSVRLGGENRGC